MQRYEAIDEGKRVTFPAFEEQIRRALEAPLPGLAAQRILAPRPGRPRSAGRTTQRDAAGLLLLYPAPDPSLVLTVRSGSLPQHGGQVSLPGGAVEPDETIGAAALREAHEEIGLDPGLVRLLGALTPLDIQVSRFRLHPVVGVTPAPPSLAPAEREVARILEVPIEELRDPARFRYEPRRLDGRDYQVPYFDVAGERVWGATAMILAEFLWLTGWRPQAAAGGSPSR